MDRFKIIEYEQAGPELKEIYDETMQLMGTPFVINWFKCQGSNIELLKGNWEKVKTTLLQTNIPMLLKQLILYKVSKERGCKYCTFLHQATADKLGLELCQDNNFKITEDLEGDFIPASYKTALRIVSKCALDPLSTTDEDFEDLRNEGFTDLEIQELMAQADLINMLNTIADISGIDFDKEMLGM
ncbi:MAG: carboxymuconolactone decarboxylase family protein [Bacteroidia bacterium]|nr:carboxymuconolactone decarboxylase family protein [Bacteroidia bacterium]